MSSNPESARLDFIRDLLAKRQGKLAGAASLKDVEDVLNEVLFEVRRDFRTAQVAEGVKSKADLKTPKDKSAYIASFGADAYLALPAE